MHLNGQHTRARVGLWTYSARGHDGLRPWKVFPIPLGGLTPLGEAIGISRIKLFSSPTSQQKVMSTIFAGNIATLRPLIGARNLHKLQPYPWAKNKIWTNPPVHLYHISNDPPASIRSKLFHYILLHQTKITAWKEYYSNLGFNHPPKAH